MLLDGKTRARAIVAALAEQVAAARAAGAPAPRLNVVLIGSDPVSLSYIAQKEKAARAVGVDFSLLRFDPTRGQSAIVSELTQAIAAQPGSWIVQLPIPAPIDEFVVLDLIPSSHDVDCLSAVSYGKLFRGDDARDGAYSPLPPTPAAIIDLLEAHQIALAGKHVVLIGAGRLVGKPLWSALVDRGATITTCTVATPDLATYTRQADVVISAAGKARLITADMLKPGVVVIDAGASDQGGRLSGDVDTRGIEQVASALSPVPGGVGPITVAKLLEQVVIRGLFASKSSR